jgi:hypothetical protein
MIAFVLLWLLVLFGVYGYLIADYRGLQRPGHWFWAGLCATIGPFGMVAVLLYVDEADPDEEVP